MAGWGSSPFPATKTFYIEVHIMNKKEPKQIGYFLDIGTMRR